MHILGEDATAGRAQWNAFHLERRDIPQDRLARLSDGQRSPALAQRLLPSSRASRTAIESCTREM